jgi:hypothetical protein
MATAAKTERYDLPQEIWQDGEERAIRRVEGYVTFFHVGDPIRPKGVLLRNPWAAQLVRTNDTTPGRVAISRIFLRSRPGLEKEGWYPIGEDMVGEILDVLIPSVRPPGSTDSLDIRDARLLIQITAVEEGQIRARRVTWREALSIFQRKMAVEELAQLGLEDLGLLSLFQKLSDAQRRRLVKLLVYTYAPEILG